MSSEFELVNLGALAKLRSGYSFKGTDWTESGTPVIKIANVKAGRIVPAGCAFVDDATALAASVWLTQPDDILMAMTGYVGEVARVRRGERYLINQRVGRFDDVVCSRVTKPYLFYVLQHPEIRSTIEQIARGSAQANLSAGDAHKIQVPLPPLSVQIQISEFLTALDDRITLLRETNATLEAIAQALFKSWFVDFDPVRAKQEGRTPEGMDEATAALFPDGFEESELGAVPRGWRTTTIGAVSAQIFSGGTPDTRKPEYWIGDTPWFSSGETRNRVVIDTEKRINQLAVENSSTKLSTIGDVLIASAGQGHTRGQTSFNAIRTYINQSVVAVRANRDLCEPIWIYYNLSRRYEEMRNLSDSHSSRGSLTTKLLAGMTVIAPSKAACERFADVANELMAAQVKNEQQAKTLATLRDTLLPRLISGRLRLPEVTDATEYSD